MYQSDLPQRGAPGTGQHWKRSFGSAGDAVRLLSHLPFGKDHPLGQL